MLEATDEQRLAVLDVTLTGTFRCTGPCCARWSRRATAAPCQQRVGAGLARPAGPGALRGGEGGRHGLTCCAALDAQHGIRVNAVAPSLAIHPFLAKVTSEELLAELAGREAFGHAAHPGEVANVIVFLASDYASYLTGEVVSVSSQHP